MADSSKAPHACTGVCWRSVLDVGTTIIVLIAALLLLRDLLSRTPQRPHSPALRNTRISVQGAPSRGNPNAKAVIVEYSDFECPSCARAFHELLPQIDREYVATGRVLLAFRNYPLASVHKSAVAAALGAECAARQAKFWPVHDLLFAHRGQLDAAVIRADVVAADLDVASWDQCISSQEALEAVDHQRESAAAIGIRGTPTFLIGVMQSAFDVQVLREITGVGTLELWRSTLEEVLK